VLAFDHAAVYTDRSIRCTLTDYEQRSSSRQQVSARNKPKRLSGGNEREKPPPAEFEKIIAENGRAVYDGLFTFTMSARARLLYTSDKRPPCDPMALVDSTVNYNRIVYGTNFVRSLRSPVVRRRIYVTTTFEYRTATPVTTTNRRALGTINYADKRGNPVGRYARARRLGDAHNDKRVGPSVAGGMTRRPSGRCRAVAFVRLRRDGCPPRNGH